MTFDWSRLDSTLVSRLSHGLGFGSDPIPLFIERYGLVPDETFIRETWSTLLQAWLRDDDEACGRIADILRFYGVGRLEILDDHEYLRSCRNAKRLRAVVLEEFLGLGHAPDDVQEASQHPHVLGTENASCSDHPIPGIVSSGAPCALDSIGSNSLNPRPKGGSLWHQHSVELPAPPAKHKWVGPVLAAGLFLLVPASLLIRSSMHSRTVELGERKHVAKLLALPESGPTVAAGLNDIERFRRGNWRHYLTPRALSSLNQKSTLIHRGIAVQRLAQAVDHSMRYPMTEGNVDEIDRQTSEMMSESAFQYLDPSRISALGLRHASIKRLKESVARRKEAERLAQEAAARQAQEAALAASAAASAAASYGESSEDHGYIRGPRGGCYYWSSGGSKVYVERSLCN